MKRPSKKEFRRLMHCGHGRCAVVLQQSDPEPYRNIVLQGCLNDYSYDMQSEGSRGYYMHLLVKCFPDPEYFIKHAAEHFLAMPPHGNESKFQHLCDFLGFFASESEIAADALDQQNERLRHTVMHTRRSMKKQAVMTNYSYLCIIIMQCCDMKVFLELADEIGAYFLKNDKENPHSLYQDFDWFMTCAEEAHGKEAIAEALREHAEHAETIARFCKVMKADYAYPPRPKRETYTADTILQLAVNGELARKDVLWFARSTDAEKLRLAEITVSESNTEIRARLLQAFSVSSTPFPLDAAILVSDAKSGHPELENAAMDALYYLKHRDCVRAFALELLKTEVSADAVCMLIRNYHPEDAQLLLAILKTFKIDRAETSHWHSVVSAILDMEEENNLPDDALLFIYEKCRCSFCRFDAVEDMHRRGIFTPEMAEECRYDAYDDTRSFVRNL